MSFAHYSGDCQDYHQLVRDFGSLLRPKIVCLCGSTRFMNQFMDANEKFTRKGLIVLTVAVVKNGPESHWAESISEETAQQLDELHKRKIDLCDFVYVLNVNGYIGESTLSEINYALKNGKPVEYLWT